MIDLNGVPYIAGLFEGEGTIYTMVGSPYRTRTNVGIRKTPQMKLSISMTDYDPLYRVIDILGFGKINGPYMNSRKSNYGTYILTYNKFEYIQAIVAVMWEWLSPRRQEQCLEAFRRYRNSVPIH